MLWRAAISRRTLAVHVLNELETTPGSAVTSLISICRHHFWERTHRGDAPKRNESQSA